MRKTYQGFLVRGVKWWIQENMHRPPRHNSGRSSKGKTAERGHPWDQEYDGPQWTNARLKWDEPAQSTAAPLRARAPYWLSWWSLWCSYNINSCGGSTWRPQHCNPLSSALKAGRAQAWVQGWHSEGAQHTCWGLFFFSFGVFLEGHRPAGQCPADTDHRDHATLPDCDTCSDTGGNPRGWGEVSERNCNQYWK
jgi:hypothetical protein